MIRRWFFRVCFLVGLLVALAWALCARLFEALASVPFYVWCDWREEFDSFCQHWRAA